MIEYRSQVDWWIGALLIAIGALVPLFLVGALLGDGLAPTARVSMLAGAGFLAAMLTGLVWPVRYRFTHRELVVRSGLLRQRIRYADITAVEPTRAPWSSPALSLDRLRIRYRGTWLLVSPVERESFLGDLRLRAPQLAD